MEGARGGFLKATDVHESDSGTSNAAEALFWKMENTKTLLPRTTDEESET